MRMHVLAARFASGLLSLLLLSVVIFLCTQVLPGNAVTVALGEDARPEAVAELTRQLGLDRPLVEQYGMWLLGVLRGDLGVSISLKQAVGPLVLDRFLNSLSLACVTVLVAGFIAIPLGVVSAIREGRLTDKIVLLLSYVGVSIPDFVLAPLMIIAFAMPPLSILPSSGFVPLTVSPLQWGMHMVLPVLTLTMVLLAHLVRQTRSGMLEIIGSNYVRTARLKGIPEPIVILRHALPSGLTAAITVLALDVGYIMGSVVIVEEIFALPGLGRTMLYAIANRDIPLIQATTLLIGGIYILSMLVADLIQHTLNPKLSHP